MNHQPHYFLRTSKSFNSISEAQKANQEFRKHYPNILPHEIGYHIPQPRYKSWVPSWLIRLLIDKNK